MNNFPPVTKRCFNEQDRYLPEAGNIESKITNALYPIISAAAREGYSFRDLQLLCINAAFDICVDGILCGRDLKTEDDWSI